MRKHSLLVVIAGLALARGGLAADKPDRDSADTVPVTEVEPVTDAKGSPNRAIADVLTGAQSSEAVTEDDE